MIDVKKMKKLTISAMCIILVVLIALFAYLYVFKYKPSLEIPINEEELYIPNKMDEAKRGEKSLIAQSADGNFKLYKAGDFSVIEYKGSEKEFSDWSRNIAREKPEIYCADFNDDGEDEYVIKALKEIDEATKERVHCLYTVFINPKEDGTFDFTVKLIDRSDWHETFSKLIKAEISQPIGAQNRIQVAMNTQNATLSYNSETGILSDGHGWYARVLADTSGKYYTFKNWEKGFETLVVNEKNKTIDMEVPVYITYNEVDTKQKIGVIRCGLVVARDKVSIRSRSLLFVPNESYTVTDPSVISEKPWSCTVTNTAESRGSADKMIDKLAISTELISEGKNLSVAIPSGKDDSSMIDKIIVSDSAIKVYAKSGYDFAKTKTASRAYSVEVLNSKKKECDASFSAEIINEDGRSVLVYTLDKSYPFSELKKATIKFGV